MLVCLLFTLPTLAAPRPAPIISLAPDGNLTDDRDPRGHRPPDFTTGGY
ncbi:MAG: hypothetical protein HZA92_17385, partial [Verrucomicrobia bacterium]|nr:hypothetical protein [Verrucomicrobiota bacterium]